MYLPLRRAQRHERIAGDISLGHLMTVKPDDDLIITPIPALCLILLNLEKEKGSPLTEGEVVAARDGAACMAVPRDVHARMEEARGYRDLDLENVWEDWLGFRAWMAEAGT
jgi:hypothetical protein